MKTRLLALTALAALTACSQQPAEKSAPEAAATEEAAVVADPALTKEEHVGSWESSLPDGTADGTTTINADGSYSRVAKADGAKESGSWAIEEGKTCFDPAGDDPAQPKRCYIVGAAGEDGSRPLQGDDGVRLNVKKTS